MKTKYKDFLLEKNNDFKFNETLLKNKLIDLRSWIPYDNAKTPGLGMQFIIESIFDEHGYFADISDLSDDIQKFESDLEILKLTNFPQNIINQRKNKPVRLVKTVQDGELKWHPVSKLNTNYYDLSELLVYVIGEMIKDENPSITKIGIDLYDDIISDAKSALLNFKPRLKKLIEYYLITKSKMPPVNGKVGLGDFMIFTKNIIVNSEKGEHSEQMIKKYLESKGFDILIEGGDGDLVDMRFGIDLVVYHENYGYKTIQVKSYKPSPSEYKRYNTDWIADTKYGITIVDKNTLKKINLALL